MALFAEAERRVTANRAFVDPNPITKSRGNFGSLSPIEIHRSRYTPLKVVVYSARSVPRRHSSAEFFKIFGLLLLLV
jgi:hypothetical protein